MERGQLVAFPHEVIVFCNQVYCLVTFSTMFVSMWLKLSFLVAVVLWGLFFCLFVVVFLWGGGGAGGGVIHHQHVTTIRNSGEGES